MIGQYLIDFFHYILDNKEQIFSLLLEHIRMTFIAVGIAILIGVPLGLLISYVKKANKAVLAVASVIQAIPSMALLGIAIPLLGIGVLPSIVVVVLYSLLPIIKNTFTGIQGIDPELLESARGIGLTKAEVLFKVQIPLALPVIMAGIRISAVTAVGLMTMAAYIGGGGLGYLVFSGISTVNNNQILAGAIPACILALIVDFLLGVVEKLVTPVSMQKSGAFGKKQRRHQIGILIAAVVIIGALLASSGIRSAFGGKSDTDTIYVGGKDFTEQRLLCELVSQAIEDETDLNVVRESNLGGTQVCFGALETGEIDLYIEYTGTAYAETLKHTPISDVEEVYDTVKEEFAEKYDITVLDSLQFNNTYMLAVTPEFAKENDLHTISDLRKINGDFVIETTLEFMNREDGLPGLAEAYDLEPARDPKGLNGSLRYTALENGECDVIDAFLTDGLLKKFNLTVLEDDKGYFPPYYAIPVVRSEVLEAHPELEDVFEKLYPLLTNDTMQELNYEVDELQKTEEEVASEFLEENGF